jgi:LysM repeat protein
MNMIKYLDINMKASLLFLISTSFMANTMFGQQKITVEEYINSWKYVAVKQMEEHGIPASISLAQGILESGFGNSKLAREGNNHFGIKCHDWNGETINKDDDKKNECFRKYENAMASFEDHSVFLTTRNRYAFLFDLKPTDYRGWAKGLKKAGYATNPKYPNLLIDLINRHDLDKFDDMKSSDLAPLHFAKPIEINQTTSPETEKREVLFNKRLKYIVVEKGDTFYTISQEFSLTLRQLHKYNDFPKTKDHLVEGDIIYIMPKNRRAKRAMQSVEINEDKEAWELSQKYGIRLKSVLDLNDLENASTIVGKGTVVVLR